VALLVAVWLAVTGTLHGGPGEGWTLLLLSLSGIVTVGPLLMFGMGAKRLRLSTVGLLQYIAPTLLFIEGITFFGEPLNPWQLVAFVMIWAALAVYTLDGVRRARAVARGI
jgi:chloramphenicol-sensitive protein RarD